MTDPATQSQASKGEGKENEAGGAEGARERRIAERTDVPAWSLSEEAVWIHQYWVNRNFVQLTIQDAHLVVQPRASFGLEIQ